MNDASKLAQYDELLETCEALRANEARLVALVENWEKRYGVLRWSLECAIKTIPDVPELAEAVELKKARRKK